MRKQYNYPVPDNPLNFCRECGQDFSSVLNFDLHRVGPYNQTGPSTRRCLDTEELKEIGLELNDRGRWHNPQEVDRMKAAYAAKRSDESPEAKDSPNPGYPASERSDP